MAAAAVTSVDSSVDAFTVPHFRAWAAELELDSGDPWVVEPFFEAFLEDYFAGIPECWLLVPEGNTKTTSVAGLAVYLVEFRSFASIPWAASSREQAEIGYRQAEGLVLRSPRLRSFLKCQEGYRRIKNTVTGGRIQVFAADDKTGDGVIPTDAFLDELHRQRDLRLYRTWRGKLLKRGGQMATISTAGEPGSEFEETREQIRQSTPVVERRPGFVRCRSDQIVLHEYAVPEGGDVDDMALVKAANPFSGITVEALAAKRASPTMTPGHWRRFVCNLATRGEYAAINEQDWFAAKTGEEIPEGVPVDVGLDLGWSIDTTALVPLWWRDREFRLLGPATVLVPPRDGTQLDPHLVERAFADIHARNPIARVVMDPSHGRQMQTWLEEELGTTVVVFQNNTAGKATAYERFMDALRMGWLRHTGDSGLTRHALNASARVLPKGDARFERPVQSRRDASRQDQRVIDALDAASMVHSEAVWDYDAGRTVYEDRGVLVVA